MSEKPTSATIPDSEAARINAFPDLSSILPIVFANGSTVGDLAITCENCGQEKHPDSIKFDGNIRQDSAELNIYAVCYECRLITPAVMRIHDDGSMMTRGPGGNVWHKGRYSAERPASAWGWCKLILSKLVIK